jgi:hypothetical protein
MVARKPPAGELDVGLFRESVVEVAGPANQPTDALSTRHLAAAVLVVVIDLQLVVLERGRATGARPTLPFVQPVPLRSRDAVCGGPIVLSTPSSPAGPDFRTHRTTALLALAILVAFPLETFGAPVFHMTAHKATSPGTSAVVLSDMAVGPSARLTSFTAVCAQQTVHWFSLTLGAE